ncbi:RNA polymerase sigma factor [Singulisphaera rosea]
MRSDHYGATLGYLHRLFHNGTAVGVGEGRLLERFVDRNDEVAFEALVSRLGPLVLGVCRRLLDDPRDVEDAFQATFLILVKKAASIRDRDHLGGRGRERPCGSPPQPSLGPAIMGTETYAKRCGFESR